ncbi:MAG: hypothetical protein JSS91_13130 [Bacteroidetes bacterium]|nr:hypothetical protein [Bacteroidota bacterium]
MRKTKIFRLLNTFSKNELKEFGRYINSAYFNRVKKVSGLFRAIKKYYPDFNIDEKTYRKIFSELYPDKKYNPALLRNIFSDLFEHAEKFVSFRALENSPFQSGIFLVNELYSRNLNKMAFHNIRKLINIKQRTQKKGRQDYYDRYQIENLRLFYFRKKYLEHGELDKFISSVNPLDPTTELIRYFLIVLIQNYNLYYTTDKIIFMEQDFSFIKEIIDSTSVNFKNDDPFITAHYYMLSLISRPSVENYRTLRTFFKKNENIFNDTVCRNIYGRFYDFCSYMILKGEGKYNKELFKLYREEIERGLFSKGINPVFFRKVVQQGLLLNELKFTEEFTEEFRQKLKQEERNSNYLYSKALINFYKKDYDRSLSELSSILSGDTYLKYEIRVLYIMIYFETGATEQLYSLTGSFRQLLKKDRSVPEIKKSGYINFISMISEILKDDRKRDDNLLSGYGKNGGNSFGPVFGNWIESKIRELN